MIMYKNYGLQQPLISRYLSVTRLGPTQSHRSLWWLHFGLTMDRAITRDITHYFRNVPRCVSEALQKESQTEVRPAVFRSTWTKESKT